MLILSQYHIFESYKINIYSVYCYFLSTKFECFFQLKFFLFLIIKNMNFDSDPDPHSPKSLDTAPDSINMEPKHWFNLQDS
jgi:hypothetical protein